MDYRISGRVIISDDTGKILLVEQAPDFWVIPGGGVEEGEIPTQAAIREVHEETGLEVELARLLWCTEAYSSEFNKLYLEFIYLGRIIGGELGAGEHQVGFFNSSEFEQMGVFPKAIWPDGEFWKLLTSNFTDYDPMGPRLPLK